MPRPVVIPSIMDLFDPDYVERMHQRDIAWFACVTTLADALVTQEAASPEG